jgi:hypothetical protein
VPPSTAGLFAGLILGLAGVLEGFGDMLIVGLCGLIGFVVVKVLAGDLDLSAYLGQRSSRR